MVNSCLSMLQFIGEMKATIKAWYMKFVTCANRIKTRVLFFLFALQYRFFCQPFCATAQNKCALTMITIYNYSVC